jgi:SulP family sulfate permease
VTGSPAPERESDDSGARRLAHDLVAGVSVASVLVPQSLAYAQLAGMPAVRGLYAAAAAPLAAAPLGSSPYLQPGPTAVAALLTFGALSPLAVPGSARFVALGILLALLVGLIRIAVAVLRLGSIVNLVSRPMLIGFVPAAGILIVASQIPAVCGLSAHGSTLRQAASVLAQPWAWNPEAVAFALGATALIVLGGRVHPLFPGILLAAGGAIALSELIAYSGPTVGKVEIGLPPFSASMLWGSTPSLLLPALVIAVVGFTEAAAIAQTYAVMDRRRWSPNREFLAQGTANLASSFAGGFPVGASFSRSALNRLAGARTTLSSAVTGASLLLFLPFAPVLAPLPLAVLGATVIVAVAGLLRPGPLRRLYALSRPQFAIAATTFAATLVLAPHVEWAIVLGVGISVANHLIREIPLDIETAVDGTALVIRPRGVIWFGSAPAVEQRLLRLLADHREARSLEIDLAAVGRIDLSGALAVRALARDAEAAGLAVRVTNPPPRAARLVSAVVSAPVDLG